MKYITRYLPVKKDNEYKGEKLFLCSYDIKVGDMIQSNNSLNPILLDGNILKLDALQENHWYKIIGEISDKVNWLQDGDEILEEELYRSVSVRYYNYETEESDWVTYNLKGYENFTHENYFIEKPIKIKCKCCNTFL